jgi:hypothetical protein
MKNFPMENFHRFISHQKEWLAGRLIYLPMSSEAVKKSLLSRFCKIFGPFFALAFGQLSRVDLDFHQKNCRKILAKSTNVPIFSQPLSAYFGRGRLQYWHEVSNLEFQCWQV